MVGTILVVAVLALATVLGLVFRARSGQMRDVAAPDPSASGLSESGLSEPNPYAADPAVPDPSEQAHGDPVSTGPEGSAAQLERALMDELGIPASTEVTLLQFSSSFCQPCRATRLLLGDVAATVPGVEHIEVDVERHMDLVRRFDIRRTPTVFVLDSSGLVRKRASGQPRRADVVAAVAAAGATVPRQ